eukprot:6199042-Pleurochrysis_carterae.AAC.5
MDIETRTPRTCSIRVTRSTFDFPNEHRSHKRTNPHISRLCPRLDSYQRFQQEVARPELAADVHIQVSQPLATPQADLPQWDTVRRAAREVGLQEPRVL